MSLAPHRVLWVPDWHQPFKGPFRANIEAFLQEYSDALPVAYRADTRLWKTHLVAIGCSTALYIFEESHCAQHEPCCDPCRIIGNPFLIRSKQQDVTFGH